MRGRECAVQQSRRAQRTVYSRLRCGHTKTGPRRTRGPALISVSTARNRHPGRDHRPRQRCDLPSATEMPGSNCSVTPCRTPEASDGAPAVLLREQAAAEEPVAAPPEEPVAVPPWAPVSEPPWAPASEPPWVPASVPPWVPASVPPRVPVSLRPFCAVQLWPLAWQPWPCRRFFRRAFLLSLCSALLGAALLCDRAFLFLLRRRFFRFLLRLLRLRLCLLRHDRPPDRSASFDTDQLRCR